MRTPIRCSSSRRAPSRRRHSAGFNQAAIPDQGAAHLVTADSYEEDFGLTNEQVRETLKAYNERVGV
jgi:hypothetical protein